MSLNVSLSLNVPQNICTYTTIQKFGVYKEFSFLRIIYFIKQGCINLIKKDTKLLHYFKNYFLIIFIYLFITMEVNGDQQMSGYQHSSEYLLCSTEDKTSKYSFFGELSLLNAQF